MSKLTLNQLNKAFETISEVCTKYLDFEIGDENLKQKIQVRMRSITPMEDTKVLKGCLPILESGSDSTVTAQEYLTEVMVGVLSFSIVKINDLSFDTDKIFTGDKNQNGIEISVPKHKAVADILKNMPRPLLISLHAKFVELMNKVDAEAENSFRYISPDLDFDIQKAEDKLKELKQKKEEAEKLKAKGGPVKADYFSEKMNKVDEFNKTDKKEKLDEIISSAVRHEIKEQLKEQSAFAPDEEESPVLEQEEEKISPEEYEEELSRLEEERKRVESENLRIMELREKARRESLARKPTMATVTNSPLQEKQIPETINNMPVYRMKPQAIIPSSQVDVKKINDPTKK